ncbi:hypothetical protein JHK82_022223 [Glycine max]|uniref:Uncharacterized protein n=1 Tax=Glycine soja TaxID=3848 RepID=A0A445JJ66_GLYSO|nr:hypothetical protein JHK85_022709 [Glycine max]KAG5026336.1 hypothetical protein JHK86_022250 [Glycine max]KAG5137492.1 hypothetical protein JHK82_022223 [Glycine max]RZB98490.1 hypothetical protein D0Y65_021427 [Glycine soja]
MEEDSFRRNLSCFTMNTSISTMHCVFDYRSCLSQPLPSTFLTDSGLWHRRMDNVEPSHQ